MFVGQHHTHRAPPSPTIEKGPDPRQHLRERTAPHQGQYRCHPAVGRSKIMHRNLGTADALSMSISGRWIVLISGLSVAVYVMWPETGVDVTVPDPVSSGEPASSIGASIVFGPSARMPFVAWLSGGGGLVSDAPDGGTSLRPAVGR
jgi:hypothetical protein